MTTTTYVQMPQDDMAQIEQIVREYDSDPAKGMVHGVQKDAIQNGFGARLLKKEKEACKTWEFCFELHKIRNNDALTFWDQGTFGLTGDLLTSEQISEAISSGTLNSEQRLGRFLARLVSGGNLGPGIFGRGKLIFHGASKTSNILIDSKRSDDGKYIALDRKVVGNRLMQPNVPFSGKEAENFIIDQTEGILKPLSSAGTRVTILNVDSDLVKAFKASFSSSPQAYRNSLAHMIEETWWEIVKFGAQIILKDGSQVMQVALHEPLKSIITAKDSENGIRVHEKENISVTVGSRRYRIKELRLVVMPKPIDEEYREVWIQRKRMKIGRIYRHIDIHPKISQRLSGYIILEPDLENIVEEAESPTHYGFNLTKAGIKQIRQILQAELSEFEKELGLVRITEDATSQKRLLDSMREISEYAPELGLMTQESAGIKRTEADIIIKRINLPNPGTLRVELGDRIGPIDYSLNNTSSVSLIGDFEVCLKQSGRLPKELYRRSHNLSPDKTDEIHLPPFEISSDEFERGKPLDITAIYTDSEKGKTFAKLTRRLYVGMPPPDQHRSPVQLTVTCRFPRKSTRRVEISDVIRNIIIKVTNTSPHNVTINLTSSLRYLENKRTGRPTIPLATLLDEKMVVIKGQTDHKVKIDDIEITQERFSNVLSNIATTLERKCDIFTTVRLFEDSEELGLPRRWILDKMSIPFYLEVDPPGFNIFKDCVNPDEPSDGRPSWYEGSAEAGYTFYLNIGHTSYRFIQSRNDEAMLQQYGKEQMVRQAYLIAFENDIYKGPAADFKDKLTAQDLPVRETIEIYDQIVGNALNTISMR